MWLFYLRQARESNPTLSNYFSCLKFTINLLLEHPVE